MLEHAITESPNPASAGIDRQPTERILEIINEEDHRVPDAVRAELPQVAAAVDRIVCALRSGGRLFFSGAGTSGRLGILEAAECPPTFSVPSSQVQALVAGGAPAVFNAQDCVEDDSEAGATDLDARNFEPRDVLVGISASGESQYVLGAVAYARQKGAVTIGISCCRGSSLACSAEIAITPVTGPEIIAGSTRLKAATATKLVLNMLSTASMIRLGHVYDNLMVNVQPTNRKLRERAKAIISRVTGAAGEEAAALLDAAGGNVKAAIVMQRLGVSREEAERRLAACGWQVAEAIA
jgi:N-acetylmuramic acid 6-phosphate etherase